MYVDSYVIRCNWFVLDACSILYAICPGPLMLLPFPHVACLNSCMCFRKSDICFNSFITWAKKRLYGASNLYVARRDYQYVICANSPNLVFVVVEFRLKPVIQPS